MSFTKHERLVLWTVLAVIFFGGLIQRSLEVFPQLRYAVHYLDDERVSPRIDLNRATEAQLLAIPGIGPVMAKRILEYRREHGRFASAAELDKVSGIGPKKLQNFLLYLRVEKK